MPGLRIEHLVEETRQISNNTQYGSNDGISDNLAITLANTALKNVYRKLQKEYPNQWIKTHTIDLVSGTDLYDFPPRLFLGKEIIEVKYSFSGQSDDLVDVNGPIPYRFRYQERGRPTDWGYLNGQLFLSPIPDTSISSGLVIYYREELVSFDVRRGITDATTDFNTSTLVFDTGPIMDTGGTPFDTNGYTGERDYINIVDLDGNFLVRNIRVTAFNTGTGAYTVPSSWTGSSSDSDPPQGSFITRGYNATTNTPLNGDLDEAIKWELAALMYGKNKNTKGQTWCEQQGKDALADFINLFSPVKHKGPINILGFNDVGDPYNWF
jgi:hypothetical protein